MFFARLANNVREEVGDVTILVNNAGVAHVDNILDLNEEKIERTFQVNILAHFWVNVVLYFKLDNFIYTTDVGIECH